MSTSPKQKSHVRKLWRLASSRCSFCNTELYLEEKEGILGNMAHIVAESKTGPRGYSKLTLEERNSYPNLILLCPNHHSLIDNDVKEWTVEKLHEIKQKHEDWIKHQLSKGEGRYSDINPKLIHYINLTRLVLDPSTDSYFSSSDQSFDFDNIKSFSECGFSELIQIRLLVKNLLKNWAPSVLTLSDVRRENLRARINFEIEFRTKNVPGPDKLSSFKFTGKIQKDPHIYCLVGQRKIYISINPRWITTDTAFGLFKSGRITLSGVGILNSVQAKEACITPLIIGSPDYSGSELM